MGNDLPVREVVVEIHTYIMVIIGYGTVVEFSVVDLQEF